ncbi:MAG: molybdopterin-dependent oxidoreductase, partial [Burkholderiaceae bacterium]
AIVCLPALIGAWRVRSGGVLLSSSGQFPVQRAALERPDLRTGPARTINMVQIGDALLQSASDTFGPAIEAVIVYNSNPVAVAPQSVKVARGFAREDLFTVVLEHFMTDTADLADYVLPATTQLEHLDVHTSYGHTWAMFNEPAVAPLGESRPNTQIFRDLAARIGFDEPCFADSDETLARTAFNAEVDFEALRERGWFKLPIADAPFADGGFPTPSGRCIVDSPVHGVPDFVANYESASSAPELARRYPLAMISPPARNFLNSSFVNLKSLRDIEGEPVLEIHETDARDRGIDSECMVRVWNDRGSYLCKAVVSRRARPGVVNGLGVWWRKLGADGTNVNELTHQRLTDIGRAPTFYDCLVEVRPAHADRS